MCSYRRSLQNSEIPDGSPKQVSKRPRYSDNPDRYVGAVPNQVFPWREVRLVQFWGSDLRLELVWSRFPPKRLGRGRRDPLHCHGGKQSENPINRRVCVWVFMNRVLHNGREQNAATSKSCTAHSEPNSRKRGKIEKSIVDSELELTGRGIVSIHFLR